MTEESTCHPACPKKFVKACMHAYMVYTFYVFYIVKICSQKNCKITSHFNIPPTIYMVIHGPAPANRKYVLLNQIIIIFVKFDQIILGGDIRFNQYLPLMIIRGTYTRIGLVSIHLTYFISQSKLMLWQEFSEKFAVVHRKYIHCIYIVHAWKVA